MIKDLKKYNLLKVDSESMLFDTEGMEYIEFASLYGKIRHYAVDIVKKAPDNIKEKNLLEQQISEVLKNAIQHGNKDCFDKKVYVWYKFTENSAHIIVEDEGEGFKNLDDWNDFQIKRTDAFWSGDINLLEKYISYKSSYSDINDGGNSLFAAVEYWNCGIVYNTKKNKVALKKIFNSKDSEA